MVSATTSNGISNGHSNGHHANGNGHSAVSGGVHPTAAVRPAEPVSVNSSNVTYTPEHITAKYTYSSASVKVDGGKYEVTPVSKEYEFKTERTVPKTG